jgi:hypothetical protein
MRYGLPSLRGRFGASRSEAEQSELSPTRILIRPPKVCYIAPISYDDVDFQKIMRNSVESKLAYHGVKYDEQELDLILGEYTFRRTYWCKPQYICFGRVEYDVDHITKVSDDEDSPDEVPAEVVLFQDPGYRMWLSTRYITAVIGAFKS